VGQLILLLVVHHIELIKNTGDSWKGGGEGRVPEDDLICWRGSHGSPPWMMMGNCRRKRRYIFSSDEIWNWDLEDFIAIKGELPRERRRPRLAELC
jgi:hypothetical protein